MYEGLYTFECARFRNLSMFCLDGHYCLEVLGNAVMCDTVDAEPSSAPKLFRPSVKR